MEPSDLTEREQRLGKIVFSYLQAAECGDPPDRDLFLAENPEFATELKDFLADRQEVDDLLASLKETARFLSAPTPLMTGSARAQPRLAAYPQAAEPYQHPRVFGEYRLIEMIGRGGMGVVFKARQLRPNRIVAIKMIMAGDLATPEDVGRFRSEAEAAGILDHPNIVPIYEVGECEGRPYFSMKLIEGGNLAKRFGCKSEPEISVRDRVRLIIDIARAVHHAHQRGVLHRDLKPGNILLDPQGRPYISDFGLAKRLESDSNLTLSGAVVGTPSYMAPERMTQRKGGVTTATDVYGVGAILYAILTGRPPFRGESVFETLELVQSSEPVSPSKIDPRIDGDLESICLKCLEKEPGRRYPSAQALAEDLERWLAGESTQARPIGWLGRGRRWFGRNPVIAGLTLVSAILSLTLFVGMIAGILLLRLERDETRRHQVEAESQRDYALDREYAANISLAMRSFENSNPERARELLDRHRPKPGEKDRRGFEWYYVHHLLAGLEPEGKEIGKHQGEIFGLAYSPDGGRLATASADCTAAVWDVGSGQRLFELRPSCDDVNCTLFTPDGRNLIVSCEDGSIWTCDGRTGKGARRLAHLASQGIAAHAGAALLCGPAAGGAALAWQLVAPGIAIPQIAIHPDGSVLAAACWDGSVRLYDYPSGRERAVLFAHAPKAESVCFTPDGQFLISGGRDGTVKVWDIASAALVRTITGHLYPVKSVAASRKLGLIASASYDDTVRLWDRETGREIACFHEPGLSFHSVAFSSDFQVAATTRLGDVLIWDVTSRTLLQTFPSRHEQRGWSVAFSPDGNTVASVAAGGQAAIWNLAARRPRLKEWQLPSRVIGLVSSKNGLVVATSDGSVRHHDFASAEDRSMIAPNGQGAMIAIDQVGQRLAIRSGETDLVQIWDLAGLRQEFVLSTGDKKLTRMALSPEGSTLATTGWDASSRFWNLQTRSLQAELSNEESYRARLVLSPNWKFAWSANRDGAGLARPPFRQIDRVWPLKAMDGWQVAFDAEAKTVAIARQSELYLWETEKDHPPVRLGGHRDRITALAFFPDGKTLASATTNGVVKLWHVGTQQELLTLGQPGISLDCIAISPDGQKLITGGMGSQSRGQILTWEAPRSPPDP